MQTIIKTESEQIFVTIPKDWVGRTIEVSLRTIDEISSNSMESTKKKPSDFFGTLSQSEGEKFQKYANQSREEWNRNI